MTNKEAISVLERELDGIPFDLDKSEFEQALEIAIKAINLLGEEKTAYWIRQETPYGYANSYECSECGRVIWNDEGEEGLEDFPYCHCGCRMVKEKEE